MSVFNTGSGPALVVAGMFQSADGITVNGLAQWKGTWSAFPGWQNTSTFRSAR
jgi:hypothetical protein